MAVEQSERHRHLARDVPLSLSRPDETCAEICLLSSSCHGTGDSAINLRKFGSTPLSRMDEDSKDCLPTSSMSSQTETFTGQLPCGETSSSGTSTCTSVPNDTSFAPSRSTLENDDTGSSSISLSSAATHQSRGPTESHSSESFQQEDDNSDSLITHVNGKDRQLSHRRDISRKEACSDDFVISTCQVDGKDGHTERMSSSINIEHNDWRTLVGSPLSNSSNNVHRSHVGQLLSEWNDSPFVSSYRNQYQQLEVPAEEWSSYGLPWHIDLQKVVTGDMVATGSYGMVFKGIYEDKKVAVKVLLIPEACSKDELNKLKANFLQEIDLWYTLSHPNIVKFIGAHVVPPRWAIVTEFLDGGSLRAFLSRQQGRRLSQTTVHAMALDIARGMEYLHQNSIMHRDLKSGNLLLDENGAVKVADFGLARFEAEDPGNLTAETGTIRWMAPEVICHMPYTPKIDVYSYGIVLWELCTSLLPYEGMSFVQLAHAVANDHHRPPTSDLPSNFVNLMRQCWDKDATKRPDFAGIVKYLNTGFVDGPKMSFKAGFKTIRTEIVTTPRDDYSRPTTTMRGGRPLGRARATGPSYVANTDDTLLDDDEWVSIRRQCRCTIA